MTYFFGEFDARAIVSEHIKRAPGQPMRIEYLKMDPRKNPELKYVEFRELNWNYVGHLNPGDKVAFMDQDGTFGCIWIGQMPSDISEMKKVRDAQKKAFLEGE